MRDAPQVKASVLQAEMAAIGALGGDEARRIRAALPARFSDQVGAVTRVDWLPVEMHAQLAEALVAVLGTERVREFWRHRRSEGLRHPIVLAILRSATTLFGLSPHRLLRLLPRAYGNVYRHAGSVQAEETGERECRVVYRDIPAVLIGSPAWRLRAATAYEALLDHLRLTGEVMLAKHDAGSAVIMVRWNP